MKKCWNVTDACLKFCFTYFTIKCLSVNGYDPSFKCSVHRFSKGQSPKITNILSYILRVPRFIQRKGSIFLFRYLPCPFSSLSFFIHFFMHAALDLPLFLSQFSHSIFIRSRVCENILNTMVFEKLM